MIGLALLFSLLCINCSKLNHTDTSLRNRATEYISALQKGDITKIYEFELPAFKARNSLENYKAHDLFGLTDSVFSFHFRVKGIQYQNDTATILFEAHLAKSDSIVTDTLKALLIRGIWYIPTYSSDINLDK